MDRLLDMVRVTPSKKTMKAITRPIYQDQTLVDYNVEYFDCVDVTISKAEWERIQRIVEIYDMANRHPAMRDIALQYHMMWELVKKEV